MTTPIEVPPTEPPRLVVLIDVEGEHGGRLPAKFDMMPAAINVKVGG